jgi:hypothetical protein
MSESRDLDALIYQVLTDDTDRRHGEHILELLSGQSQTREQRNQEFLDRLMKAHQARAETDKG